MGGARPPESGCALLSPGRRTARRGRPPVFTYSLASGVFAMSVGAAASLAATSEVSRIAAWCVVTAVVATLAGFAYESALTDPWWRASCRWLSRFGRD
jgi:hypothetical protein